MKMFSKVTSLILGACLILGALDAQGGVYSAWGYRMKIRVAVYNQPETLTNFPMLVTLSTNIPGFSYSNFNSPANGADLRFAASNETTELDYDIDQWDTNGNSYVWVQVPAIASTNDYIYAYWSKAEGVAPCTTNGATWTNGFKGVWHLGETSGTQADSTSNKNGVTMSGTVQQGVSGLIGGADDCTSGFEVSANNLGITGASPRTTSLWFKQDSDLRRAILGFGTQGNMQMWDVLLLGGVMAHYYGQNSWAPPYTVGVWQHATVSYDGSIVYIYVNGELKYQEARALNTGDAPLVIGSGKYDLPPFNGKVDEVQISTVARSSNWVWATWLNQASNSTFLAFSEAGSVASSLTVVASPASGVGSTNATLNGTVVHAGGAENPKVYICWDTTDKGTNNLADWTNQEYLGTNWGISASFSTNITGLLTGSSYVYRCYVTNSTGTDWSDAATSFTTVSGPTAISLSPARIARLSATLNGQITATGGEVPSAWFYYWADGAGTTNSVAMGAQSGNFSNSVAGLSAGTLYHYYVRASNGAGVSETSVVDFTTRSSASLNWYVSSSGDNTYATSWATALTSVQEALNNAGSKQTEHNV